MGLKETKLLIWSQIMGEGLTEQVSVEAMGQLIAWLVAH